MQVSVSVEAHPGKTFMGTVKYIGPKAGESLLFPVEIVIPNDHQYRLKAGMTSRIDLNVTTAYNALLIPRIALLGSVRDARVYVVENNIAHIRQITAGSEFDSDIEILSGLKEGDVVITVGTNNIRDGVPVIVSR